MDIIIGAPVYEREWSLPRWFDSMFKQGVLRKNVTLLFGITDGEDNTRGIIDKYGDKCKNIVYVDCNDLEAFRDRDSHRFVPLAEIRNRLLQVVLEKQPDYYFSWDTDILLPDKSLRQLIEDDKDLVSPYVELMPGVPNCVTKQPNVGAFRRLKPHHVHYPKGSLYQVDASFAVLLFQPQAYDTLYGWHQGGEDYAFALNALEKGLEFWMDSRVEGLHLYHKDV